MTAATWSDGYVTEIDYTYGAYREMSPAAIRFAMLNAGQMPPALDGAYRYCELGFGQGVGLNLLAAANPQAQFHGTDFNPSQVVGAQHLARRADLPNVHFHDDSFEAFAARTDLPPFDVVALHGIYSWVSPANRAQIVRFLDRCLKPGGVVYISYNSLPGWAPMQPLQWLMNLLQDRQTPAGLPVTQRISSVMDTLGQLAQLDAGYCKVNPSLRDFLGKIRTEPPSYLAHEYFNREWHPLHFMTVAEELSAARLGFAGSADVGQLVDGLHLPREAREWLMKTAPQDALLREQLRDYLTPARFRKDLFVRGLRPLSRQQQALALRDTPLVLVRPRAACALEITTASGRSQLAPQLYGPLLDALADRPLTLGELCELPVLRQRTLAQALPAIRALVSVGHAAAGLPGPRPATGDEAARRLNSLLCREAQWPGLQEINYLAAPVIGGAIGADALARCFGHWCAQGGEATAEACARHAAGLMQSLGLSLNRQGEPLSSPEALQAGLLARAAAWLAQERPLWMRLGVPL